MERTWHIYLADLSGMESTESIEVVTATPEEIKKKLYDLQLGYCEDEKPKVSEYTGRKGHFIDAMSDSDYFYIAKDLNER